MNRQAVSQGRSIHRRWLARAMAIGMAVAGGLVLASSAQADVLVSVGFAPPPLPVYAQPVIPGPGYIWVPGYWAYDDDGGYYWVSGTWVLPPYYGALWTPGYWGWGGGVYVFHPGYWGRHVGFYGGIHYGYGYTGTGYVGGYWGHGGFYYNRAVTHIDDHVHITNVYNHAVVNDTTINRTSFNGGQGGIHADPTARDMAATRDQHMGPIAAQEQERSMASHDRAMRASFNHGAPSRAAVGQADALTAYGTVGTVAPRTGISAGQSQGHVWALRSASFAHPSDGVANSGFHGGMANTHGHGSSSMPTDSMVARGAQFGPHGQNDNSFRSQQHTMSMQSHAVMQTRAAPSMAYHARSMPMSGARLASPMAHAGGVVPHSIGGHHEGGRGR